MIQIHRFFQVVAAVVAIGLLLFLRVPGAQAEESSYLLGGIGVFDVTDNNHIAPQARVEFAPGFRVLNIASFFRGFGPMAGFMANTDGGVFGYGGIFADVRFGDHIVVRPQFGVGGYDAGNGKDLGGTLQFHVGGEVAYQFDSGRRLGLLISHISNKDIHEENPGENGFVISYSVPLEDLF